MRGRQGVRGRGHGHLAPGGHPRRHRPASQPAGDYYYCYCYHYVSSSSSSSSYYYYYYYWPARQASQAAKASQASQPGSWMARTASQPAGWPASQCVPCYRPHALNIVFLSPSFLVATSGFVPASPSPPKQLKIRPFAHFASQPILYVWAQPPKGLAKQLLCLS